MPNSPSSSRPRISMVIVPFADYSLDYLRFFYDNRHVLERHGVVYPFVEEWRLHSHTQDQWAGVLWSLFQMEQRGAVYGDATEEGIRQRTLQYLEELERLEKSEVRHILLVGHLWAVESYVQLFAMLEDGERFPRLSMAEKRLVHIAEPRSSFLEGSYRLDPARDPDALLQQAMNNEKRWLQYKELLADIGHQGSLCTLHAEETISANLPRLFSFLGLSSLDEYTLPPETRVYNRDAHALMLWLEQRLYGNDYMSAMQALHQLEVQFPSEENISFLPPAGLQALDEGWAAHGSACVRPLLFSVEKPWHAHVPLSGQRLGQALRILLDACSPELRRQILEQADIRARYVAPHEQSVVAEFTGTLEVLRPEPELCVLTLTKNHEAFIAQCMDSVLAQQTRVRVRHIVVDDCSTDATRSIVYQYAKANDAILPVFLPSDGSKGANVGTLFNACRSPYAALCDGDDYFVDPHKLQKQLDFLEEHTECGLCFHPVRVVYEDGSEREHVYPPVDQLPRGVRSVYYLGDLFKANFIQTNSVLYRWRFAEGVPPWFRADLLPGDWYWHLLHAETGKIGFINESMSVYRRHRRSLYYSVEAHPTSVPHRLQHGMAELEMYHVLNTHFEKRYERALRGFTNGVLADFLAHYAQSRDDRWLQEAEKAYPDFVRHFMQNLKIVSVPKPRGEQSQ